MLKDNVYCTDIIFNNENGRSVFSGTGIVTKIELLRNDIYYTIRINGKNVLVKHSASNIRKI